ncbi:MAG: hypothetical protein LUG83_10850 [Lachnospiraceae bacterium]|nr:hypothetical protein [Lachnospiraceae bacterium]
MIIIRKGKVCAALLTVCLIACGVGMAPYKAHAEEKQEIYNTGFVEPVEYALPEDIAEEILYSPQSISLYSSSETDYWEQFSGDYYYSLLDEDAQSFWDEMNDCCLEIMSGSGTLTEYKNGSTTYYLTSAVSYGDFSDTALLWKMFVYSHPQYYFIANSYFTGYKTMSLVVYSDFYDADSRNTATSAFKTQIEEWKEEITESSPEKIEKQIHDILCNNVSYDNDNSNDVINQSAYSTFINKTTVCAGYCKGFQLLGSSAGLEVIPVIGAVSGVGHAWNKINLHDYWYVVDVTWDDQSDISYSYYNKSDDDTSEHVEDTELSAYIPDSSYSSTSSSGSNYIDAYFTSDGNEYFSVSGDNPYLALYIGSDSDAELPQTVTYNSNTYTVINSSASDSDDSETDDDADSSVMNGWYTIDGVDYWYENGVRQGTEGRGKEIYDPDSDAWYWLDAVQGGAKAVSKDVYQESYAGRYADLDDGTGKWVRYDDEGKMVKGWDYTVKGTYYFDTETGTMAKGYTTVNGKEYYFNTTTGICESGGYNVPEYGWMTINGVAYWYEDYYREGYSLRESYRGKEIYDSDSGAWYWLDNVQYGAKTVSKDVYQESDAGEWAECEDGTGKWVRYDENGHMVKGWSYTESGSYYFDLIYGTMAKGSVTIDGTEYYFDESTGILR